MKQGAYGDPLNVWYENTERSREIYDPGTNTWYWLDALYGSALAECKEVFSPYIYQGEVSGSTGGKWVKYDSNGHMIKGLYISGDDKIYVFHQVTGAMTKGFASIQFDFGTYGACVSASVFVIFLYTWTHN